MPVGDHEGDEACAKCGKHGSDTVKLKNCTACRLVKYCGVDCQKAHRKQHKNACKKRATELKDDDEHESEDKCGNCGATDVKLMNCTRYDAV